ncbi:MAG: stage II sporulation protein M [Longispora sp.]|nr:stage II sporulation protein M [Longispora sp. (in: high G+C Gram-positive bacteria)]
MGDRLDLGITARPVEVSVSLWWAVFSNNASVALIVFAGVLTLGVATIAFTLVLGLMTGASLAQAMASSGWGEMTRHVLPHGWIELPAIGVAVAAGIVPLTVTALALVGRERPRPKIRDVLADSLGLLGVSLVLLLIAATIETLVST